MTITLSRKKLLLAGFVLIEVLAFLHLISALLYFNFDGPLVDEYVAFFDFGLEENVPTYFSSILLLIGSVTMALVGFSSKGKNTSGWLTLAVIFLLLSIDEITQIHEAVGDVFEDFIPAEGILYHVWVVPYLVLVVVTGAILLPFFLKLTSDVKKRFIIAGCLYIGGAIGIEMIGSIEASANGMDTYTYTFLYSVEELCEMLGALIFIDAAMIQLTRHDLKLTIQETDDSDNLKAQHLPQKPSAKEEESESASATEQSSPAKQPS